MLCKESGSTTGTIGSAAYISSTTDLFVPVLFTATGPLCYPQPSSIAVGSYASYTLGASTLSISASTCPPGYSSWEHSNRCYICPAGSAAQAGSTGGCQTCAPGYQSQQDGQATCSQAGILAGYGSIVASVPSKSLAAVLRIPNQVLAPPSALPAYYSIYTLSSNIGCIGVSAGPSVSSTRVASAPLPGGSVRPTIPLPPVPGYSILPTAPVDDIALSQAVVASHLGGDAIQQPFLNARASMQSSILQAQARALFLLYPPVLVGASSSRRLLWFLFPSEGAIGALNDAMLNALNTYEALTPAELAANGEAALNIASAFDNAARALEAAEA
jgi:hypothetical protein